MKRMIVATTVAENGYDNAIKIQKFIDGYGFEDFFVYENAPHQYAIDVEGEDEDEVIQLLNRLRSIFGKHQGACYLDDHYIVMDADCEYMR